MRIDCSSSTSRMRVGRSAIGLRTRLSDRAAAARCANRRATTRLPAVLDLRLYRVTLLPFALGLIIVAFSLHAGPSALRSSLPRRFDAAAAQTLAALAAPGEPGSAADDGARAAALTRRRGGLGGRRLPDVRIVAQVRRDDRGRRADDRVGDRDPRRHRAGRSR